MRQLLKIVVLLVVSLLAIQPLLAEEPCAPVTCSDTCAPTCCADMHMASAQAMSASCHAAQTTKPMKSTQSQHRCDATTVQMAGQVVVPEKFKAAVRTPVAMVQAPLVFSAGRLADLAFRNAPHVHPDRYLLLQVFRI